MKQRRPPPPAQIGYIRREIKARQGITAAKEYDAIVADAQRRSLEFWDSMADKYGPPGPQLVEISPALTVSSANPKLGVGLGDYGYNCSEHGLTLGLTEPGCPLCRRPATPPPEDE